MAGRTWTIIFRVVFAFSMVLAVVIAGCGGTPRERYRVLSYFFDGVPNPDAPKATSVSVNASGNPVITASIVSQHKPYLEAGSDSAKCDQFCHGTRGGEILEFAQAYGSCIKCHAKVSTSLPRMHGPVAREACKFCHVPHESTQPHLLRDEPVKLCTQCHDQQLLGDKPAEHLDGKTSCLNCHFGHGGPDRYFLRPAATAPADVPATSPAAPLRHLEIGAADHTDQDTPGGNRMGEGGGTP